MTEYRNFDCVIVDEVSKATPPELILPLLKGKKIVLVGDHKQLPPMIGLETYSELVETLDVPKEDVAHIERSLFKELFDNASDQQRSMLVKQYRMHPQIMMSINQFYQEKLECAIKDPDQSRAHGFAPLFKEKTHLAWIDIPFKEEFYDLQDDRKSSYNLCEVDVIENILMNMDKTWASKIAQGQEIKEVGIITFYSAQTEFLRQRLLNRSKEKEFLNLSLRIGSVDRFQAMEKKIIIVSLVRNNSRKDIGFAKKFERINVAFSRAKELLLIVGSSENFTDLSVAHSRSHRDAAEAYQKVFDIARLNGQIFSVADFSKPIIVNPEQR